MWVRSQDKKLLIDVTYFAVDIVREPLMFADTAARERRQGHIGEYVIKIGCDFLGYYATEKRALAVLDKIEKNIGCGLTCVFHMPSEEEAKIFEDL